ncbi:MAG: phosphoglycolate phosphatase [Henriciella sp.]
MAKLETKDDALALLMRIQEYWSERGYNVQGSIREAGYSERLRSTVYEVETDMVAGFPRRKRDAA